MKKPGILKVHLYEDEYRKGIQIVLPTGEELFWGKDLAEDVALNILARLKPGLTKKEKR